MVDDEKSSQNGLKQASEPLGKEIKKLGDFKPQSPDIKSSDTLTQVTEQLQELKDANDATERELLRQEHLRAKATLGGKSDAGEQEETAEEIAQKEAVKILDIYK